MVHAASGLVGGPGGLGGPRRRAAAVGAGPVVLPCSEPSWVTARCGAESPGGRPALRHHR